VAAWLAGVIEVLDAKGYDTIACNVETPAPARPGFRFRGAWR
jgi:hypothetical protein